MCISVSAEKVKSPNKCAGLGLLNTGGLSSRSSSPAPAAAPTEGAPLVARATLPFLVCAKSHGAASHRGGMSGHTKVGRCGALEKKAAICT